MQDASLTLTLFHDGQFYVGIFERGMESSSQPAA